VAMLSSCGGGFTRNAPQELTTPIGHYVVTATGQTPIPTGGFQQVSLIVPLNVT